MDPRLLQCIVDSCIRLVSLTISSAWTDSWINEEILEGNNKWMNGINRLINLLKWIIDWLMDCLLVSLLVCLFVVWLLACCLIACLLVCLLACVFAYLLACLLDWLIEHIEQIDTVNLEWTSEKSNTSIHYLEEHVYKPRVVDDWEVEPWSLCWCFRPDSRTRNQDAAHSRLGPIYDCSVGINREKTTVIVKYRLSESLMLYLFIMKTYVNI